MGLEWMVLCGQEVLAVGGTISCPESHIHPPQCGAGQGPGAACSCGCVVLLWPRVSWAFPTPHASAEFWGECRSQPRHPSPPVFPECGCPRQSMGPCKHLLTVDGPGAPGTPACRRCCAVWLGTLAPWHRQGPTPWPRHPCSSRSPSLSPEGPLGCQGWEGVPVCPGRTCCPEPPSPTLPLPAPSQASNSDPVSLHSWWPRDLRCQDPSAACLLSPGAHPRPRI